MVDRHLDTHSTLHGLFVSLTCGHQQQQRLVIPQFVNLYTLNRRITHEKISPPDETILLGMTKRLLC